MFKSDITSSNIQNNLAKVNGGNINYGSHSIIKYGTMESIINTMYGTTNDDLLKYSMMYFFHEYIIDDFIIDGYL